MPGIPYNASLSFGGNAIGSVVGLQVETPQAELVDMTSVYDPSGSQMLVPTGAVTGGSITVDYLASGLPSVAIGTVGAVVFTSTAMSVSKQAVLESATVEARTGELVRGTMKFRLTDYTGT